MLLTTVTLTDKSVLGSMALLDGTQLASAAKGVALHFFSATHKEEKTKSPNACKSTQPANQTF